MSYETVGAYFDERAETWLDIAEPAGLKHVMIAQLARVHENSRVLDIGCGAGIMERAYLELGASTIIALDVSQKMIDCARAQFAGIDEDRLCFKCCDVLEYDDEEGFDVLVIYNAYPHILNKEALVQKASTLLKPQGRFLVAHGMSRETLNAHHGQVPANVTSDLLPVQEAIEPWQELFEVDMMADTPFIYFFGGSKRA